MGTPVPIEVPDLEDAKWYLVKVDGFFQPPPDWKGTCADDYVGSGSCCRTGADIKIFKPNECRFGFRLCLPPEGAQRMTCCTGPYDTEEECVADL